MQCTHAIAFASTWGDGVLWWHTVFLFEESGYGMPWFLLLLLQPNLLFVVFAGGGGGNMHFQTRYNSCSVNLP